MGNFTTVKSSGMMYKGYSSSKQVRVKSFNQPLTKLEFDTIN